jgi:hypothetical protein
MAVPHERRVTVHVPGERLGALIDHLHRLAGVEGEHAEMDVQVDVLTGAESPTDPGGVGSNLVGAQTKTGHHLLLIDVDKLTGGVEVDAAVAVGNGQTRLGTQGGLVLHTHLVEPFDYHRG